MLQRIKKLFGDRENQLRYLRWLMSVSKPFVKQILIIILIRCGVSSIGILTAAVNKQIVDSAQIGSGFATYVAVSIVATALSIGLSVAFSLLSVYMTERYSCSVRVRLYRHILSSTWIARNSYHSGDFITRLTNDMSIVARGVVDVTANTIATVIQFVFAFVLLWHYDASLATVGIMTGPVIVVVCVVLASKLGTLHNKIQEAESEYRVFLQEQFTQTDTVKIFEQEKNGEKRLVELQEKRMYWIRKRNKTKLFASAIISLVFSGTYLFAFCTGAMKISTGAITFGTMTAFLSLIGQVQTPMYTLANLMPQMVGTLASAGRIMKLESMESEPVCTEKPKLCGAVGVCAQELSLSYGSKTIIENLSFDIKPGEFVMLKGSSGVGKTTILRSLLGFISPDKGTLSFVDCEGNAHPCSAAMRSYISYVPQGNTLFNGTIAENLRMANPDASDDDLERALKAACAWEFVSKLPDGTNTKIGEKGSGISEGQAQRIAIARSLLKPAGIIIMDEATSALDTVTEEKILSTLKSNLGQKTCLFVSHRESVSQVADRILEIQNTIED